MSIIQTTMFFILFNLTINLTSKDKKQGLVPIYCIEGIIVWQARHFFFS